MYVFEIAVVLTSFLSLLSRSSIDDKSLFAIAAGHQQFAGLPYIWPRLIYIILEIMRYHL